MEVPKMTACMKNLKDLIFYVMIFTSLNSVMSIYMSIQTNRGISVLKIFDANENTNLSINDGFFSLN